MNKKFYIIGALLFLLMLCGCSSDPVYISKSSLDITDDGQNGQETSEVGKCQLFITITDERPDKKSLGELQRPVYAEDMTDWLSEAFKKLRSDGYQVVFNNGLEAIGGQALTMDVKLKKAYIKSVSASKITNVVFGIRYFRNDNMLKDKVYRGIDERINWASSENEINSAFNHAFTKALLAIRSDLKELCKIPEEKAISKKKNEDELFCCIHKFKVRL
ncbi:MAG: hypothetical protein A2X59_13095 [Nitrospirae bacterium GWC2_42_7]|nr:MAG: hypothetical protein A2X59_13095 [Nitrospirae bacterium GWC2_42_7]